MNSLKIRDDFYLIEEEVQLDQTQKSADNLAHIWIYDRSGSMTYLLPQLIEDMILKSRELKIGDVLSIGWFSGESEYRFVLKGFKISDTKDYSVIEKTLRAHKSSIGTTCFSEILHDANKVVQELSSFGLDFSLMFLTDGYPVVSNYQKEIKSLYEAIDKLEKVVTAALLVGYGNYYNKELMSIMTSHIGGTLIHSQNLSSFSLEFNEFLSDARENGKKTIVAIPKDAQYPFSINKAAVNVYVNNDGKVSFAPSKNVKNYIYYVSDKAKGDLVDLHSTEKDQTQLRTRFTKASYALAYLLSNKTKTNEALDVLGNLGDVAMIDGIVNAFTNAEYGSIESKLKKAVSETKHRFVKGQKKGYLPDEDAFCIVDLVDVLTKDEDAVFYPYHKDFEYNKISISTEQKENYPKFTAEKNPASPFHGVVWNKKMLNLSIRAKIEGTVELPEAEAKKFGFAVNYPTFIFRSYSVVKDGFLNIPVLYVGDLKKETIDTIRKVEKSYGIEMLKPTDNPEVWALHLEGLPVMNRGMAKKNNSAIELCKKAWQENVLEGYIKAAKWIAEECNPTKAPVGKQTISKEASDFLAKLGITAGGYRPQTVEKEPIDFYLAKEFDIKIKGFSSFPKIQEVFDKEKSGKALTPAQTLLKEGLTKVKNTKDPKVRFAEATTLLEQYQKDLAKVRAEIQRTKFALLLGKVPFKEFESREEQSLEVDGNQFTITLREVKVPV